MLLPPFSGWKTCATALHMWSDGPFPQTFTPAAGVHTEPEHSCFEAAVLSIAPCTYRPPSTYLSGFVQLQAHEPFQLLVSMLFTLSLFIDLSDTTRWRMSKHKVHTSSFITANTDRKTAPLHVRRPLYVEVLRSCSKMYNKNASTRLRNWFLWSSRLCYIYCMNDYAIWSQITCKSQNTL